MSKESERIYQREYARKRRSTPEGRAENALHARNWRVKKYKRAMLTTLKIRAEKRGIEFSIGEDDVEWPYFCPVFGVELIYSGAGRGASSDAASFDRCDNSKGYVSGNVFIISWRANRIKNDADAGELRAVADWVDKVSPA